MRETYTVGEQQMGEWKSICRAFAKREGAELVFVNAQSMGLEYPDGTLKHVYIDELIESLK